MLETMHNRDSDGVCGFACGERSMMPNGDNSGDPLVESLTMSSPLDDSVFLDGVSPAIRALDRIVAEIAPTDIPVLLVGESGSGKEVLALRIHLHSTHREEGFTKLICAGLAPHSVDDMIHASSSGPRQPGLFSSGTVFLDGVSDLDLACQPRLLRLLPDGGLPASSTSKGARIISATIHDLEGEVRNGQFREELYYRLNGVCLRVPPLRHRREDIPYLVDFFLSKYAKQFGRGKPSFSPRTLSRLTEHSWPGNIRQLENVVKKVVALGDEKLALGDLDMPQSRSDSHNGDLERFSLKQVVRFASRQAERELILKALERTHWNRKRAARELQISYKAFLYKLKQIGFEDGESSSNPSGERR